MKMKDAMLYYYEQDQELEALLQGQERYEEYLMNRYILAAFQLPEDDYPDALPISPSQLIDAGILQEEV